MRMQRGLSLVELMVGLFVGMLVILAATGTAMFFEASKRTSAGTANALENATLALYSIERDARMAGLGFVSDNLLACTTINIYYNGVAKADSTALAPVVIVDGEGQPDSITIRYASSLFGATANRIIAGMPTPSSILKANSGNGLAVNNLVLLSNPGSEDPCTLIQVTHIQDTGFGTDIQHNPGTSPWNSANPEHVFSKAPAYPAGSVLLNIGSFNWLTYRVRNNALELVDEMSGSVATLADNVVFLRAQYGVTDGLTQTIDQWVDAKEEWKTLDPAHIRAIRAVRVAVVARSPHPEKPSVPGADCDATSAAPVSWPGGPTVDLSADANWKCYKYRAFSVVVPLKNVIWGGV